jgi:hypothetical protein
MMKKIKVGSKVVVNMGRGSFNGKVVSIDGDVATVEYVNTRGETVRRPRYVSKLY